MPPSVLSPAEVLQEGPPMRPATHQETNSNTSSTSPALKLSACLSSESSQINRFPVATFSVGGGNGSDVNNDDDGDGLIGPVVGRISIPDQDRQHQIQQQQQQQQQQEDEEEAKRSRASRSDHVFQSSPRSSSTGQNSSTSGSANSSTRPQSHVRAQSQQRQSSLFLTKFWEEVEDDLFVLLNGHLERFQILQSFFFDQAQQQQQPDFESKRLSSSFSLMTWISSVPSKSSQTTRSKNDSSNNNNSTPIVDSSRRSLAASVTSTISGISRLRTDKNYRTMVMLMQQLSNISQSMAYLVSQWHRSYYSSTGDDQINDDKGSTDRMKLHDEHISFLASFFASTTPKTPIIRAQKVAVVNCLVKLCLVASCNDKEINNTEKNTDIDDVISGSGNCCNGEPTLNCEDVKKEVNVSSTDTLALPTTENERRTETETETSEKLLRFMTVRRAGWPYITRISDDGRGVGEEQSPSTMLTATPTLTKCISSRSSSRNNEDGTTMLMTLIFEIRAQCLRLQEEENERRLRRIRRMTESSDDAAMVIAASAKLVELGIHQSNKLIERKIESAAKAAKEWVEVDDEPLILDRDAVVAMAFSDTAKRASEYARKGTAMAVDSILDVSISSLHKASEHLMASSPTDGDIDDETNTSLTTCDQETDQNNEGAGYGMCGGPLSPCERREMLKAAGKVGMAAFGAASLVGEAVVHTGRSVASKTAGVAADIVSHKYGSTAGNVVKNAGDTAGNLASAASNVALIDSTVLAKHVAKNASRVHIDHEAQRAKDRIEAFEKRVTSMMSNNLGIQVGGDWVGQIESLSKSHQHNDLKEKE